MKERKSTQDNTCTGCLVMIDTPVVELIRPSTKLLRHLVQQPRGMLIKQNWRVTARESDTGDPLPFRD